MQAKEGTLEMTKNKNRWKINSLNDKNSIRALSVELNVNEIVADLLLQRGIKTKAEAERFFNPSLSHLHDPYLMKDMDKAVERILKAIASGEKILVYGDYDVDGTTAVTLVYTFLRSMNAQCGFYIPDRYAEGYGISFAGIDFAEKENYSLIIALDCGIKANDKVEYAKSKKVDFVICDHHRPGDRLPDAVAVLDPKRDDCTYPYDELCGCGIGFKLVQALAAKMNIPIKEIEHLLDLVAVAIAADIVPLTGENRVLAKFGLEQINSDPRPGFAAMIQLANIKRKLSITDIVFIFAPRINAAGRIEHGKLAVELLTSQDSKLAYEMAEAINKNNTDRREIDQSITTQAIEKTKALTDHANRKSTVVHDRDWHKGVVGIVASRLIERYYRPTIVLTSSNGKISGSARSVKDFDVYEAIEACSDLLVQFGGHKYAAGLTMEERKLDEFVERFEAEVSKRILPEQLIPQIEIDAEIDLKNVGQELFDELKNFAPHGPGNMSPVFLSKNVCDRGWAKVVKDIHLKFDIIDPKEPNRIFPAIGFGLGNHLKSLANKNEVDICYAIEENEWNGKKSLQLNVKDIRTQH